MMMTAAGVVQAQEIQQRKENQQDRIANGVANGSLTPHETANLENKEAALNRETRRDRRQNGGNSDQQGEGENQSSAESS